MARIFGWRILIPRHSALDAESRNREIAGQARNDAILRAFMRKPTTLYTLKSTL